ncbi:DsbA family protein [Pontibacter silvestris]|uniref:DsbA family protein n=1 Tax=Pontibacter silvestris TaxID=2305183 RepID=A0ABW4WZJ4_9BACT|nr:DsbA family protein [Pontibacter silvestris]MCC9138259.1 DsbA family protein [Pontibacter silvestris]
MEQYDLLDIPHLIYVMDPMCSWCYGFAPVLKRLIKEQEGKVKFKLVMGGLRPGTTEPMDEEAKESSKHHWQQVQEVTEQPFDFSFFDRDSFVYDTEPGCRAVIAMRYLQPTVELEMAEALQNAFYAHNKDITKPEVLVSIATKFGVEADVFLEKFNSALMQEKTQQDFVIARHLQANAFPSLYLLNGNNVFLLNRGYRMYEALKSRLEEVIRTSSNP